MANIWSGKLELVKYDFQNFDEGLIKHSVRDMMGTKDLIGRERLKKK